MTNIFELNDYSSMPKVIMLKTSCVFNHDSWMKNCPCHAANEMGQESDREQQTAHRHIEDICGSLFKMFWMRIERQNRKSNHRNLRGRQD